MSNNMVKILCGIIILTVLFLTVLYKHIKFKQEKRMIEFKRRVQRIKDLYPNEVDSIDKVCKNCEKLIESEWIDDGYIGYTTGNYCSIIDPYCEGKRMSNIETKGCEIEFEPSDNAILSIVEQTIRKEKIKFDTKQEDN